MEWCLESASFAPFFGDDFTTNRTNNSLYLDIVMKSFKEGNCSVTGESVVVEFCAVGGQCPDYPPVLKYKTDSESSDFNWLLWGAIGAAALVVIVLIVVYASKASKKKKEEESLKIGDEHDEGDY